MAPEDSRARRFRLGLVAFVGFAGVMHFANPRFFDDIVPSWMPGAPRTTTHLSGVAELTCAALVANRRTARIGGWATLLLFIAVYPANVQMTIDVGRPSSLEDWLVWARTPLQVPMLLWARRVARHAGVRPSHQSSSVSGSSPSSS
ncbi:MAG: DoxX family protein [Microthrixaceae bacterium]